MSDQTHQSIMCYVDRDESLSNSNLGVKESMFCILEFK